MNDGSTSSEVTAEQKKPGLDRRALLRRSVVVAAVATPIAAVTLYANQRTAPAVIRSTTRMGQAPVLAASSNASKAAQNDLGTIASNSAAFKEIQADEDAHVQFLVQALGSAARPKPTFKGLDQADLTSFANLSRTFENVGVGAYLMAAPAISDKKYLAAAGSILTIEARHAGFLDVLLGQPISANGAFDKPIAQADIVTAVTPFVASLNGGSDPSGTLANDTDILNFALLLEYLEASFYDINVPKFFGGATPGNG